jgi:hypothetical protein
MIRAARAEGSDNLTKAYAQTLATENAMRDRFPDCQVDGMYSPELLRIEAAECRRGAIDKSARVERTLLALAEGLESEATILGARVGWRAMAAEDPLAMTQRHVLEAEGHVERQEALVAKLDRDGHTELAAEAREILAIYRQADSFADLGLAR